MKVKVLRDPKESFERMLARFKKLLQRSHKIVDAKFNSRHHRKPSKRLQRNAAIAREGYRSKREQQKFYLQS